jgi:LysR family transcriptional regulator, benzoate and cis,cis-muconate-responsive activator of ben and cat genes
MFSMEIRHLRYFLAVAEELHFSRAAARLSISVPTLSHTIRSLETMLGAQLFRRKTNSAVSLTHVGRRFLEEARSTIKQLEHAELIGRRAARGEAGSITLGYVLSACCNGLIADALIHFRKTHPEVSVQVRHIETFPQFKAIIDGTLDVGIMRMPRRYPSGLAGFVVGSEPFRLVLPEWHPLASRQQIPTSMIAKEPVIAAPLEMEPGFWGNLVSVNPLNRVLNIVERAPDAITVLTLVAAGVGIGVVSSSLSRIAIPGIVYRDITGTARSADQAVVYRRNEASPVVTAFLKALRQKFPKASRPK